MTHPKAMKKYLSIIIIIARILLLVFHAILKMYNYYDCPSVRNIPLQTTSLDY